MLNIADMRTRHSREAFDSLREHVGEKLFEQTIRRRSRTPSRPSGRCRSSTTGPTSALDYLRVADELLGRLGLEDARRSCSR